MKAGYSNKFTILMTLGIAWSLYWIAEDPPSLAGVLSVVVFCYLLTDIVSGLLHIILDNPRSLDIKLIESLADGFQKHHADPKAITQLPLYEHLYVMHLPLTLLFFAVLPLHTPLVYVVFLSMVLWLHVMQMSHRWAHATPKQLPPGTRSLHRMKLLIDFPAHAKHHREPYEKDFCIMNGLCNRPLNALVRTFGRTGHGWIAVFFLICLTPLAFSYGLSVVGF